MTKSSRVSKADWLARALEVLQEVGIDGVRIERLARDLRVAKSGFYWHFRGRADLLKQMLKYWSDEFTESVLISPRANEGSASDRLYHVMEMIEDQELGKFDLSVRAWAEHDPLARKSVRHVYTRRFGFINELFQQLGFAGQELEMRVRLFVVYHSWQQTFFHKDTKAKRHAMRKLSHAFLVRGS